MLKIALIGYGKMGRVIEDLAPSQGIEVISRIDPVQKDADFREIHQEALAGVDVCIEFSQPQSALENIKQLLDLNIPTVVGTTGWYGKVKEVKLWVEKQRGALLYAENFSIGIQLFQLLLREAAQRFNSWPQYDVAISEIHHHQKLDSPSGTAIALANTLLEQMDGKSSWTSSVPDHPSKLAISSQRCGAVPGTHSVLFDSPVDSITLTHQARGREGFATGALEAAKWLRGRQGFFHIQDLFQKQGE